MPGEFSYDYDGSSDYQIRGSDLAGNADSKTGIISTSRKGVDLADLV